MSILSELKRRDVIRVGVLSIRGLRAGDRGIVALEKTYELFPAFAADPIGELRKFILSEDVVKKYYDGLKKAGMQAELSEKS